MRVCEDAETAIESRCSVGRDGKKENARKWENNERRLTETSIP
jgi:hypothetical protein